MIKPFYNITNNVIKESDIIIEVLDARMPSETRNLNLENKILASNKRLIFVLNKCDLTNKEFLENTKKELNRIAPCIFISAKYRYGLLLLKKRLLKYKKLKKFIKVGVIGYPNTGKSSIINALKRKYSAKTSPIPGLTKAKQWIKIRKNILLIDTPGIIPINERDELKLVLINAKHPNDLKDPQSVALHIINLLLKENPIALKKRYNIEIKNNPYQLLKEIAIKRKKLKKGGFPDIDTISRIIILEWQNNKLNLIK